MKASRFALWRVFFYFFFVRLKGLEPSRPKAPDPKSGVSTNSTTTA